MKAGPAGEFSAQGEIHSSQARPPAGWTVGREWDVLYNLGCQEMYLPNYIL